MAVIVTDLNMPPGCWYASNKSILGLESCPLAARCAINEINLSAKRPNECPLKSTDEMVMKIKDEFYDSNYFQSVRATTDEILVIIDKYLNEETENGANEHI